MYDFNVNGGNVTTFGWYRKPMKNPVLLELLAHWESLRAGRIAPLRSEIDPRQIENVLEHAFILEQSEVGAPRFRIAGMALCDLMGMEVRAMPATAIIAPKHRPRFLEILNRMFFAPEIVELALKGPRAGAAPNGEMLLLPMKNDAGEITRILGCLGTNAPGRSPSFRGTPCRFTITARKATRIVSTENVCARQPMNGFAEAQAAFIPAQPAKGGKEVRTGSHLRLVKSDD